MSGPPFSAAPARAHPVGRGRPALTLIELLVVIAILALLAAILAPGLNRAVEITRRAICAGNLHQLGLGHAAYAGDNHRRVMRTVSAGHNGVSAIPMPPTDEQGHTEVNLKWSGLEAGQNVVLEAQVTYQGLMTQARAFFMAWW